MTYLVLNESEAAILSGRRSGSVSATYDLDSLAAEFLAKGVANVIITLGAEGAYYQTATESQRKQPGRKLPAIKAKVVDTTAAGDTFVGAFAVKLVEESSGSKNQKDTESVISHAIAFAIRAAGKTVEKAGAQSSIPWQNEL